MAFDKLFSWRRSTVIWFMIDILIGLTSVLVAYRGMALPIDLETLEPMPWHPGAIPAGVIFGLILAISYYAFGGEGREWRKYSWQRNILISFACVTVATILVIFIFYLFLLQIGRIVFLTVALYSFLGTFILRLIAFSIGELERRSLLLITDEEHVPSPQMTTLLNGAFEVIELDLEDLHASSAEDWISEWVSLGVQDVVFVTRCSKEMSEPLLVECWKHGLRFLEWNFFVETTFRKLNVYDEHLDWLTHFGQQYAHPSYSKMKRGIDILSGGLGLVFFAPLLGMGMLAVLISSGRPIFFKQARLGGRGSLFTLVKLRTMVENQQEGSSKFSAVGDKRITRVGRILRLTRIDELPQLLHVFSGEMSLVGPRPEWTEVAKEWEGEIPFYAYRTMVKPGLTGWAQINFSYAATRDEVLEKLSYDFYYIKHASISLDLRIILRTVSAMFEGGR